TLLGSMLCLKHKIPDRPLAIEVGGSLRSQDVILTLSRLMRLYGSRAEAKVLIERWRQFYNEHRPHSAHRYQPPATVRRAWLDSDNIDARLTA
ncbi:integrase core domain-containing protein, partial [Burkholderia multivorans]|uniref:integrase core domain-containing protein n=1 Tax=Burkholderia multivorans TaxID=87883 RepID=UPI003510C16A